MQLPINLSFRNYDSTIRSKPSDLASILDALLPVPPKYHFKEHGNTTAMKQQQIHSHVGSRNVIEHIFGPLEVRFTTGKLMLCGDSRMR